MSQQALLPGMPPPPEYGDDLDYYATPREAVEPLIPHLPRLATTRWNVLEPAAGEGAMLRWFAPYMLARSVTAFEIHEGRRSILSTCIDELQARYCWPVASSICADFLKNPRVPDALREIEENGCPWFIPLNPPYSKPYDSIGLDFIERCCETAERVPGSVVAALVPLDFACGVDRTEKVHARWLSSLYRLKRRQYFGGEHGSGQRPVAWFVFDFSEPKNETLVIG